MSNPSKQKGTAFEVSLLPALRKLDPRVERSALKGGKDTGDFSLLHVKARGWNGPGGVLNKLVVSAKNCKQISLSGWLSEAEGMRKNASADAAIVVHKKRGTTNPEEAYCTMSLGTLIRLLT